MLTGCSISVRATPGSLKPPTVILVVFIQKVASSFTKRNIRLYLRGTNWKHYTLWLSRQALVIVLICFAKLTLVLMLIVTIIII